MTKLSAVEHLFAGKPKPFGPKQSPSSIIKQPHQALQIQFTGAVEDEQGNKKLHGGPYMALHQFAQTSYPMLAKQFPTASQKFSAGSIGENICAPNMHETNVFIGDQYQIGEVIVKVVSPRAPCSKINHRYGLAKIDTYIAKHSICGWYYSVVQEGKMSVADEIVLVHRDQSPISVQQIWQLRQLALPCENAKHHLDLATKAFQDSSLAPEWQAYMHRVTVKLAKHI
jgi:MOSC domain-containing protein YiiM